MNNDLLPHRIKALVLDVDGTMTDGGMYYSAEGQVMKRFDVRDGLGIVNLRKSGVHVMIITADHTPIIAMRARVLGIERCEMGQGDKNICLLEVLRSHHLRADEVVYMGDDLNDLPAIEVAGFSACPADAVNEVITSVDYVCRKLGGHGAVREVVDMIMAHNAKHPA